VLPADDAHPGAQADLLNVLKKQGVEISRATAEFTVTMPGKRSPPRPVTTTTTAGQDGQDGSGPNAGQEQDKPQTPDRNAKPQPTTKKFRAGSSHGRMGPPH